MIAAPLDLSLAKRGLAPEESRELALRRAMVALCDGARRDPLSREALEAWKRRNRRCWAQAWPQLLRSVLALAPGVTYGDTDGPPLWSHIEPAAYPLGAVKAATARRYWEPADDAMWLASLPIYQAVDPPQGCEEMGRALYVAEMIVYNVADPARWWLRTGAVDILGSGHVEERLESGKPVRIFATPERWRSEGGGTAMGCCVVNWGSAAARRILVEARGLVADSIEAGDELQRRVWRSLPTVSVIEPG